MSDAYDGILRMPTSPKGIESKIRAVAAFAEAGADLEEGQHGADLVIGASIIFQNARLFAHAKELLKEAERLMADYRESYGSLTDGQYGKTPGTPAYKSMASLLGKIKK